MYIAIAVALSIVVGIIVPMPYCLIIGGLIGWIGGTIQSNQE